MNAGVVLSYHGPIEAILRKSGGELRRTSEYLVLDRFSKNFERVFVFSSDRTNYSNILPHGCEHIRLFNPLLYLLFTWLFVIYYTKKHDIKLLYVECGPSLPSVFLVSKLTRLVVHLNYDNTWESAYLGRTLSPTKSILHALVRIIEPFLLNFVNTATVGNEAIGETIRGRARIFNIEKGIPLEPFSGDIRPHKIFSDGHGRYTIFVGRLTPEKDPITLIKAHRIVREAIHDASLIICGDGPLRDECKRLSDSSVRLMGFVKEIPSLLKGADVFVIPSRYDASPRALIEAMAMGKPCIGTDVGGIPHYLSECGILVKPADPQILADKIVCLLTNPSYARVLGKKARRRAFEKHDLRSNLDRLLQVLIPMVERSSRLSHAD